MISCQLKFTSGREEESHLSHRRHSEPRSGEESHLHGKTTKTSGWHYSLLYHSRNHHYPISLLTKILL